MWIDGRWYNEVELAAYIDTLKTELMAVKSGSDVLKIRQLEKENAELKKFLELTIRDFGYYDRKRIKELISEGEKMI